MKKFCSSKSSFILNFHFTVATRSICSSSLLKIFNLFHNELSDAAISLRYRHGDRLFWILRFLIPRTKRQIQSTPSWEQVVVILADLFRGNGAMGKARVNGRSSRFLAKNNYGISTKNIGILLKKK